jgi:undecaprenyl-diphosphatase
MLTYLQAILLGFLQGVTELFPISSLGHSVLVPSLVGWQVDQTDPFFVSFLVLTHLATALVLLGFFWRDWLQMAIGVLRSLFVRPLLAETRANPYARLGWLLIVGTIPAGLIGLLFQKKFEALFAAPQAAALFLIGNGLLLYFAEWLALRNRKREVARSMAANAPGVSEIAGSVDERIALLSWWRALGVGTMQCLALFPGFSRTGAAMTGGLAAGLSHEDAARFSFLLATPIILAAAVLKVPHLVLVGGQGMNIALAGAAAAAIAAYLSVRYLSRYFKTRTMRPFAAYCLAAGLVALLALSVF